MVRGGLGLTGIIVIGAALYFTGAGRWLWNGVSHLDQSCYNMLSNIGTTMGTPVCTGVTRGIGALSQVGDMLGEKMDNLRQQFGFSLGTIHIGALGNLASSSDMLQRMMDAGPQMHVGSNLRQQFQQAVDSYSIGQHYLSQGGEGASQAIPWLQQGAAQPNGYGMLSQLSLGNLYSTGSGTVASDPAMAAQSFEQAKASLKLLMASNAPEAQQMLQSIGSTPQQLQQEIDQALAQLKNVKK